MKRHASVLIGILAMVVIGVPACGKKAEPPPAATQAPAPVELRVTSIDLGNQIDASKRVAAPTTNFKPNETIYVSVGTDGTSPGATLAARWTYGADGQLVNENSESISPTGPANTEFHVSKPGGWPTGKYKVEVMLNGSPAGSKDFEVK